jgi:hypothetical protein
MALPYRSRFLTYKQWQMDSLAIGRRFSPFIEKMASRIAQLQCAMLCTPDGFNLCSIGLNEEQVGKMAALSSSLFSVGAAAVNSLNAETAAAAPGAEGSSAAPLNYLTLEAGGLQIVSTKIIRPAGDFILMAAARAPLGVVLVGVRSTVMDIQKLL